MAWNNYHRQKVGLPVSHHKDDAKWLEKILLSIPEKYRIPACVKYTEVFNDRFDTEPLSHRKDGKARSEANSRLLAYSKLVNKKEQERFTPRKQSFNNFNISDI